MNVDSAMSLARRLMKKHGLSEWRFKFDNAKRRAGLCNHTYKYISLSRPLTEARSKDNVRNTILHEIAHALVGPGHGHDAVWRRMAKEIGCNGERCYSDFKLEGKWVAVCVHGKRFTRHRIMNRDYSCRCEPGKFIKLKFKKNENATSNCS